MPSPHSAEDIAKPSLWSQEVTNATLAVWELEAGLMGKGNLEWAGCEGGVARSGCGLQWGDMASLWLTGAVVGWACSG